MKPPESSQSYPSSITRIAVTQICQSVGYQASQTSALNTLADIATRYLVAIARSASASSTSANRTQSNAFDIISALEELEGIQGFTGCSRGGVGCVLKSSLFVELERFIVFTDEIPFAKPLERRPGAGGDYMARGFGEEDSVRPNHVPRWLPAMPVIAIEEGGRGRWEEEWKCCGAGEEVGEKREEEKERVQKESGTGKGKGGSVSRGGGLRKMVMCRNGWKRGGVGVEKRRVIMRFKK